MNALAPEAPAAASPATPVKFSDVFMEMEIIRHRWHGSHQLAGAEITVNNIAIDKNRVKPAAIELIPKHWGKRFNAAYGRIEQLMATYTMPFGTQGKRVVPVLVAEKFALELQRAIDGIAEVVAEFSASYDRDVVAVTEEFWLPKFPDRAAYDKAIGRLIPAKQLLPLKFSIEHKLYAPTAAAATEFDVTEREARQFYAASRANAAREIEAAIAETIAGPQRQFAEALARLSAQLRDSKAKISEGSFTQLREAMALCQSFAATGHADFTAQLPALEAEINQVVGRASMVYQSGHGGFGDQIRAQAPVLQVAFDRVLASCNDIVARDEVFERFGVRARRVG